MGSHPNIKIDKFPKQTEMLGRKVDVCFHYNTDETLKATIVRDDTEAPYVTIFQLEDGRYILATECQHRLEL